MTASRRRRLVWTVAFFVIVGVLIVLLGRPALHLLRVNGRDTGVLAPPAPGYVDDASRLNQTQVAQIWPIPQDKSAAEAQLAEILAQASRDGLAVSIAGSGWHIDDQIIEQPPIGIA